MIKGTVPALSEVQTGCRFCGRCPYATDKCRLEDPELIKINQTQSVRCHYAGELPSLNDTVTDNE